MDDLITTHRVASYECSADHLMKPEWFMLYCQEVAETHAESHGFGSAWAFSQGVAWVEVVGDFEFFRRPTWKEEIRLRTNTGLASALQARRFVEMTTPEGEVLARADLLWVLIDLTRRRPMPFRRVQMPELPDCPCITSPMPEIPAIPEGDAEEVASFTAHVRDVDFNGHINNSAYLTWTLGELANTLPEGASLRRMHIAFRRESFAGDAMQLTTHRAGSVTQHRVSSNGETRAELTLLWQ